MECEKLESRCRIENGQETATSGFELLAVESENASVFEVSVKRIDKLSIGTLRRYVAYKDIHGLGSDAKLVESVNGGVYESAMKY